MSRYPTFFLQICNEDERAAKQGCPFIRNTVPSAISISSTLVRILSETRGGAGWLAGWLMMGCTHSLARSLVLPEKM